MGRSRLFGHDTDDETSTGDSDASSMDLPDFLADFRSKRSSRLRSNPRNGEESSEPGISGVSSVQQRANGIQTRLRRRVAEARSSSSAKSTSNSPRQPGPTGPKLARLASSTNFRRSPRRRPVVVLSDTSPSPRVTRIGRSRRPAVVDVDSDDDEPRSAEAMSTGAAAGEEEERTVREGAIRRRANRLWASTTGRRANTGPANGQRGAVRQQLEADEAYARRLQAQFDAQFHMEQQQRRRRERAAMRRQARTRGSNVRPLTPPLPPGMRDLLDGTDDDDDDDADFQVRFDLANYLERATATDNQENYPRRRSGQRNGSPSGPTTLATVRRYFREAHMDANLFPDVNVAVLDFETLLELADEIGEVAPSMSTTEINRLPTTIYRQVTTSVDIVEHAETSSASSSSGSTGYVDEAPTCAICMEKFSDGDVQRNLPCFHAFHRDCVDVWLKQRSSCPVCRVDARHTSPPGSP